MTKLNKLNKINTKKSTSKNSKLSETLKTAKAVETKIIDAVEVAVEKTATEKKPIIYEGFKQALIDNYKNFVNTEISIEEAYLVCADILKKEYGQLFMLSVFLKSMNDLRKLGLHNVALTTIIEKKDTDYSFKTLYKIESKDKMIQCKNVISVSDIIKLQLFTPSQNYFLKSKTSLVQHLVVDGQQASLNFGLAETKTYHFLTNSVMALYAESIQYKELEIKSLSYYDDFEEQDFNVIINVDKFSKLIDSISINNVKLENQDKLESKSFIKSLKGDYDKSLLIFILNNL